MPMGPESQITEGSRTIITPGDKYPGDIYPGDIYPGDIYPGDIYPGDLYLVGQ